jgi:hypothetical protein
MADEQHHQDAGEEPVDDLEAPLEAQDDVAGGDGSEPNALLDGVVTPPPIPAGRPQKPAYQSERIFIRE